MLYVNFCEKKEIENINFLGLYFESRNHTDDAILLHIINNSIQYTYEFLLSASLHQSEQLNSRYLFLLLQASNVQCTTTTKKSRVLSQNISNTSRQRKNHYFTNFLNIVYTLYLQSKKKSLNT